MKTLDEPIYMRVIYPMLQGTYVPYTVYIKQYEDMSPARDWVEVFRGRFFVPVGGDVTLHFNDIIEAYANNRQYMAPSRKNPDHVYPDHYDYNGVGSNEPILEGYLNMFIDLKVHFDTPPEEEPVSDPIIHGIYAGYLRSGERTLYDLLDKDISRTWQGDEPEADTLLSLSTNILPRIPRLPYYTDKFWYMVPLWTNNAFYNQSNADGDPIYQIVSRKDNTVVYTYTDDNSAVFMFPQLRGYDYWFLTHDQRGLPGDIPDSVYIDGHNEDDGTISTTIVAKIDNCPEDYYLIWVDRLGGYQCQPFSKREITKESINNSDLLDSQKVTRPYLKQVSTTFELNSDWLNEEQHDAFESILVSPYLYLYDTKTDNGYWVNCTTTSWEEKRDDRYQKKLYNMNITLKTNKDQNILY